MLNFYKKRQGFTVINYLFIFIHNTPFRYQTIIEEIIVNNRFSSCHKRFSLFF